MKSGHWILILLLGLAPPALYASILVAAAAFGYWKAIRHPPTVRLVFVDRAAPSRAPSTPGAPSTPSAPSTARTVAAPR